MLVVLAGAAATLASIVVLRFARPYLLPLLPDTTSALAFAFIETIGELSLWFALVNVLPLPPLTGSHLLVAIAPQWRDRLRRSQPYAAVLIAVLAVAGSSRACSVPCMRCWRERCWESDDRRMD